LFLAQEVYSIVKGTRRQRYIRFHITSTDEHPPVTRTELIQAVQHQAGRLFSKNAKELGLWIVQFDGSSGIIKCKYQEKEHTRELLESLKVIGSKPVRISSQTTSGTIRGLTPKAQRRPE
jgi:RNase P/RNase MRP subunit POP5